MVTSPLFYAFLAYGVMMVALGFYLGASWGRYAETHDENGEPKHGR